MRTITVPDLTAPEAAISTPRVHRARTAREFQAIAADAAAVPAVAREFSRTERLLIRFDVYGNGTADRRAAEPRRPEDGRRPGRAGGRGRHPPDRPGPRAIAAGEYLVEITVKGATGEAKELVPFRIGS